MAEPASALMFLIGLVFTVCCCMAGIAAVCKWIGWAPVNLTVNIHNHYPDPDQ